jgi:death-on-curing protein
MPLKINQKSYKRIFKLHEMLIAATGGAEGIRDEGLLDSALASAFHTFDGEE